MNGAGVIEGGWPYVWGAYALSAAILIGYALSIHLRYRAARRGGRQGG